MQTDEIGAMPNQWQVRRLGDVCSVQRGGSPRPIRDYLTDSADGVNWIKIGDVGVGAKYIDATAEKIIPAGVARSRYVAAGAFLLSNSMSFGRPYILRTDGCIHDGWLVIQEYQSTFDTEYLYYCLSADVVHKQYSRYAAGSSVLNLNSELVSGIQVPVPTLSEQRAISDALSDVDALLGGLDRLIAKKRDLRQATMQQLLTGRARLPGFAGEWVVKRLGQTAILKARIGWQGLTTAEYLDAGDYLLVTGTEIMNGYIDWDKCVHVDEIRYRQDKHIQLGVNDVLVTKDGTIGKVALVTELPKPATLNSGVFVVRPKNGAFHPGFFYYLLLSSAFTEFLTRLRVGSTISHLYQKDFVDFSFRTPATIDEQAAIAALLSDVDGELTALEARRDKTRALKQAMMQELLTGRTRLVPSDSADA